MTTLFITGVGATLSVGEVAGEPDRNLTSILSVSKLPEYIRSEYPSLATFVKEYYTYLEMMEGVNDASGLDSVSDKYLARYKDMVLHGFGTPKFMDMRRFILTSKELFKLKGTDEAFKYFFRAYFGEEIEIKPSTYLVASGGDIIGDTFFHCRVIFGILESQDEVTIVNATGDYKILVDSVTLIDPDIGAGSVYHIAFRVPRGFKSNIGDVCLSYDTDGNKVFQGHIMQSPSRMVVVNPGKYWKRGQLLKFPAIDDGDRDEDLDTATLARVRTVDTNTGIASLEIIQHGYPHYPDQTFTVSPFEYRPIDDDITYTKTVLGYSAGIPSSYNHVLSILDNVDPMDDAVFGTLVDGYTREIVSVNSSAPTKSVTNDTNTYARWLESRATVRIEMSSISREFQVYRTNDSLLSDENTKLHDSLYYQAFAYSLISNQDLEEYKGSIDLIHPAGMKFHALMTKMFQSDETGKIDFTIVAAVDTFFWNETISTLDVQTKHILKMLATDPDDVATFTTFVLALEAIQSKQMIKPMTDSVEVPDIYPKHVLKPFVAPHVTADGVTTDTDIVTTASGITSKQDLKPMDDAVTGFDSTETKSIDKPLTDEIINSDFSVRLVGKPLVDAITGSDSTETKSIDKALTESIISLEAITSIQSDKGLAETSTIIEIMASSMSKPLAIDYINTSDGTPVLEAESRYNITGYAVDSVDNYFYNGITLTIS